MSVSLLEAKGILVADHGVGLACAGGSIGEDGGIEAVENSLDEGMRGFEIDLNMVRVTF